MASLSICVCQNKNTPTHTHTYTPTHTVYGVELTTLVKMQNSKVQVVEECIDEIERRGKCQHVTGQG